MSVWAAFSWVFTRRLLLMKRLLQCAWLLDGLGYSSAVLFLVRVGSACRLSSFNAGGWVTGSWVLFVFLFEVTQLSEQAYEFRFNQKFCLTS